MIKWKLKGCTRCLGDLYVDRDMDGWFEQCLQCSYRRELKDIKDYRKRPVAVSLTKEDFEDDN